MTTTQAGPDLRRHLAELEARVEDMERRSGVRAMRPDKFSAEEWPGPDLPTTELRMGRIIYASGLFGTQYANGASERLFIYDPSPLDPAFPANGAIGWRLLHPEVRTYTLESTHAVFAGQAPSSALSGDLGTALHNCEVRVYVQGCVELVTSPADKGEARVRIERQGTLLRRGCHFLDGGFNARPTILTEVNERLLIGQTISYNVTLDADVRCRFVGNDVLAADALVLTVVVS